MNLELTGQETLLSLGILTTALITFIFVVRYVLKYQSQNTTKEKIDRFINLASRVKHPEVDAFLLTSYFKKLGLFVAILFSIIAMSWTTYSPTVYVLEAIPWDGDTEVIPPLTYPKPKPPPPPPPPEIVEVEDIPEEDEVDFLDNDITEDDVMDEPEPVAEKPKAAPPPPPAPVIVEPDIEEIFARAEVMPRFPGCDAAGPDEKTVENCTAQGMLSFIYKHLKYPAIARENGVEGTVVLRFVVDQNGDLTNIEILRDIGAGCGKEAARVIESMSQIKGKWTPGKQRGKQVKVMYTLPVKYRLH